MDMKKGVWEPILMGSRFSLTSLTPLTGADFGNQRALCHQTSPLKVGATLKALYLTIRYLGVCLISPQFVVRFYRKTLDGIGARAPL